MKIQDSPSDMDDLTRAVRLLEAPSITAKLANLVGSPIERLVNKLPGSVMGKLDRGVRAALQKAVEAALWSMDNAPHKKSSTRLHKMAAAASGAVGGAFGFTSLLIELPVSTTIMMRAVADIARDEGFDLKDIATQQACVEVFALGGKSAQDDASETGYYVARSFTTEAMRGLSKELAGAAARRTPGLAMSLTPQQASAWLAAVIDKVAGRFGVIITDKLAAQAVPVIGAISGAAINTLFTAHFQAMARGHFIIRRLENKYGAEQVEGAYRALLTVGGR